MGEGRRTKTEKGGAAISQNISSHTLKGDVHV